jgi:hypothetical protein
MDPELLSAIQRLETKLETKFDSLDGKLDAFMAEHVPRMATLELRVTRLETSLDKSRDRRWPVYVALLSSITSPAGAAVVTALLLK